MSHSGVLFQRRGVEFSRCALARRLRAQRRVRRCHRVGQLRAVAEQDRKPSREFAPAASRSDSSGVVRLCRGRTRAVADPIAGAADSSARADSVLQEFIAEPLPELARGEFGRRCDLTLPKKTMLGRFRFPDDTTGNRIHSSHSPVWASIRVGDNPSNWITWATNRPKSLHPLQRAAPSIIAAHRWLSLLAQKLGLYEIQSSLGAGRERRNRLWMKGRIAA